MRKIRDTETIWLIDEIINSANSGERQIANGKWHMANSEEAISYKPSAISQKGIPIGNLTSQLFANVYLNKLDHFVKEDLRIRHYIRYVDDFVILDNSKKDLHNIKENIRGFLKDTLKLTLHPKKQVIFPAHIGTDFLGYRVWKTHTLLRKTSVKRMRRRLKKFQRLYQEGAVDLENIRQSVASWLGHAQHANTYNLRRKLFSEFKLVCRIAKDER